MTTATCTRSSLSGCSCCCFDSKKAASRAACASSDSLAVAPREEATTITERAFTLERLMLARAGRNRKMEAARLSPHFNLPSRSDGTRLDEAGFSKLLDEYYTARGWDLEQGWPTVDTLRRLDLEGAIAELDALRLKEIS